MLALWFFGLLASAHASCDPLHSSPLTVLPLAFGGEVDFYAPIILAVAMNCSLPLSNLSYRFSVWNLTHTYFFEALNATSTSCEAGT